MKHIILKVESDFDVDTFMKDASSYFPALEIVRVEEIGFKGKECPICKKRFEDLLFHLSVEHTEKERDELKKEAMK